MQPAEAERVHMATVPLSTASTFERFAATRSLPGCDQRERGSPKSSRKETGPTTGKTSAGTPALRAAERWLLRAACAGRPSAPAVMRAMAPPRKPRDVVRSRSIES